MPKTLRIMLSTTAVAFAMAPAMSSAATLINFESGYSDNQELADGTLLLDSSGNTTNVRISTQNDNTMSVEASGAAATSGGSDTLPDGFVNDPLGQNDVESAIAHESLGGFFLRNTAALSDNPFINPVFTLEFLGGASGVSAEIWDIDGNSIQGSEKWDVVATVTGIGSVTISSPEFFSTANGSSLNGQAWTFDFTYGANLIEKIDFFFEGTKTTGIGVAFDNLQVSQVPLPASALLLLGGLGGLVAAGRRRRKAA